MITRLTAKGTDHVVGPGSIRGSHRRPTFTIDCLFRADLSILDRPMPLSASAPPVRPWNGGDIYKATDDSPTVFCDIEAMGCHALRAAGYPTHSRVIVDD